jgi:hypothetical protein
VLAYTIPHSAVNIDRRYELTATSLVLTTVRSFGGETPHWFIERSSRRLGAEPQAEPHYIRIYTLFARELPGTG